TKGSTQGNIHQAITERDHIRSRDHPSRTSIEARRRGEHDSAKKEAHEMSSNDKKDSGRTTPETALSRRRFLQVAGASLVVAGGVSTGHFSMTSARAQGAFKLNVLHINDLHSRVESIGGYGSTCSADDADAGKCFGGYGRLATKIRERRKEIEDAGENVVTLDAGDQFQGSLFYTTYRGKAEGEFMNKIGFDAMALGNHEFDNGPDVLADFIDFVEFPVISGNTKVAKGEKLAGKIDEWVVLDVGGEKIGVLSVLTPDTHNIS